MKKLLFFIVLFFSLAGASQTTNYPLQNKADVNKPDTIALTRVSGSGTSTRYTKKDIPYQGTVTPPPGNNLPPHAKTGPDLTATSSSVILDGSGSFDQDGTIITYTWIQTKGATTILIAPNTPATTVTGLVTGNYTFQLTVVDDKGANSSDTVHVTANINTPPPPVNQAPVISIGPNQTITLPVNIVTLTGSATDPDGVIKSYLWSKISGSGSTITTPAVSTTTVTGLTQGTYTFSLTATDNGGASSSNTVVVTVLNNMPPPPPPTGYTLTFTTGYDTQADMLYGGNGQYGNGKISTAIYLTGPGSFESIPANISSGIRSEVQYTDAAQNNEEGAIEYDVMYEVIVPNNGHSLQWHPETSGGSASPGLWFEGGKFVMVNWKGGINTDHATGITVQTQHWYHVRMEYKFGSSGYFTLYIDGVKSSGGSWIGQVGDNSGHYLKVGYNGWDANSPSSRIYYDNLKIWKKG